MNKIFMGRSGHFSRSLMLLNTGTLLSKNTEYCNTVNPIKITIKSPKHLSKLIGRYYKPLNRIGSEFKLLTGNEKHLIGTDLLFRSPITCNSKDGICHTCYGALSYINKDIYSIGGFAAARITEPLSQNILSTKHLLSTDSKVIKFNDSFYTYLTVSSNEILLAENDEINLSDYSLILINDNIVTIDEYIEDKEYNKFITVFHIRNNKTGEIEEFREEDALDLYFSKDLEEKLEDLKLKIIDEDEHRAYEINLDDFETDCPIFLVEIQNKELTKPLHDIMDLLNKDAHNGCNDVEEMAQMMLDLLIISGINAASVQGELLIKSLVRKGSNILEQHDWSKYGQKYQILTITKALTHNPSPTLSMSFQDLGRQLVNPLTFKKKESSFIDAFYKEIP